MTSPGSQTCICNEHTTELTEENEYERYETIRTIYHTGLMVVISRVQLVRNEHTTESNTRKINPEYERPKRRRMRTIRRTNDLKGLPRGFWYVTGVVEFLRDKQTKDKTHTNKRRMKRYGTKVG